MGRVLVADDDPVVVHAIAALLDEEGVEPVIAEDAVAVRHLIAGCEGAIVGVSLAGLAGDGLALLAELGAADPRLARLALVSRDDAEGEGRARAALGPLGVIEKPVDGDELLPRLATALEHRRLRQRVSDLEVSIQHRDQALAASHKLVERTTAELHTASVSLATATERLVEAEKLAAVGRVVTGIAHDQ